MALRPKLIVLVGICAGVRGEVALGDVVVSTDVFTWDYGKLTDGGGFSPAPVSFPVQEALLSALRGDEFSSVPAEYWENFGSAKPEIPPKLYFGPVASGSSVIADEGVMEKIKLQNRKILAVDMEALAVHAACAASSHPQPAVITMKSVCDFADKEKHSGVQPFAAGVSAALINPLVSIVHKMR